ncbi:Glutaredoxin 3 [Blyttiomyces sp. JEL0837]|nr:Glutaredoxin 3 [Blyttiomyces sp. JEL0837]
MSAGLKSNAVELETDEQFKKMLSGDVILAVNFYATWAEQCKHMNEVFDELSRKFPNLQYVKIQAEEFPDISEEYEIEAVPTFFIIRNGKIAERINGANAPSLTTATEKYSKIAANTVKTPSTTTTTTTTTTPTQPPQDPTQSKLQLEVKLKKLINSHPVMLFIKGTPTVPRCGFSRQLIDIMTEQNVTYGSFDILADEAVRQGLKEFSNWPTFPQVYINGELVGGLDIVKEMVASGEFQKMLPEEESLNSRLQKLVKQAPVMLFMKGNPDQPRCGFSRQIVQILQDEKVKFSTFDILEDEEVRAGLKEFSNWPTFPQLYFDGELVGGLDIVKEMVSSGELALSVPASAREA